MTEAVSTPTTALSHSLMGNAITIMTESVCLLGVVVNQIAAELDRKDLSHLASALRGADRSLEEALNEIVSVGRNMQLKF